MKLRKNQSGFSPLIVILLVMVLGLIGLSGWLVYDRQKKDDKASQTTTSINSFDECVAAGNPVMESYPEQCAANGKTFTNPKQQAQQVPEEKFVEVIQADDSINIVGPSEIAKTEDQKGVLVALHKKCSPPDDYVLISHAVFSTTNYKQDGNYAYINASCAPKATNLSEVGGSGAAHLLHKATDGTWVFDFATQQAPPCSKADGLDYPTSIIPACYESDGSTTRAPK